MEYASQTKSQTPNQTIEPWGDTLSVGLVSAMITGIGSALGGSWGLFLASIVIWAFILKLPQDVTYVRPLSSSFVIIAMMMIVGTLFGFALETLIR